MNFDGYNNRIHPRENAGDLLSFYDLVLLADNLAEDQNFARNMGFKGYIEPWPVESQPGPEYMTGVLGEIVPMDDVIASWYGIESRALHSERLESYKELEKNTRSNQVAMERALAREYPRTGMVKNGIVVHICDTKGRSLCGCKGKADCWIKARINCLSCNTLLGCQGKASEALQRRRSAANPYQILADIR